MHQWMPMAILAVALCLVLGNRALRKGRSLPDPLLFPLIVEVCGDVVRPGVYLAEGPEITVEQVLQLAGGLKGGPQDGVPEDVLTRKIKTLQRVRAELSPVTPSVSLHIEPMSARHRLAMGGKLDINEASEEELLLVPQMQPRHAAAIVLRRQRIPWAHVGELVELPGIGPKTVERWRSYLSPEERSSP